jgi:hypothetical protein
VRIAEGRAQQVMQIGAVDVVERCAPAGDCRLSERQAREDRAVVPGAKVQRVRGDAHGTQRLAEPETLEHPHRVGAERQPRAHFAQNGGLLIDLDLETDLTQGERGRQPTYPSPNDEDAHDVLLPRLPRRPWVAPVDGEIRSDRRRKVRHPGAAITMA